MKRLRLHWLSLIAALALTAAEPPILPLPQAHAHNDYEHSRPLLDALDQGFCSVEADVFLVDGKLLVAHDRSQLRQERTLAALYLEPLRQRVQANGGRVFPNGPGFHLLIDFKTPAEPTWKALSGALETYSDMLSVFHSEATQPKAVTVVLSGNSPRELLAAEPLRLAAIDGRLPDLELNPSGHLVPWISENWTSHFKWRGQGPLPAGERDKLDQIVARAHAQKRKVRFWGAPDIPALWRAQFDAGVDFINTDNLAALRGFFQTMEPGTKPRE